MKVMYAALAAMLAMPAYNPAHAGTPTAEKVTCKGNVGLHTMGGAINVTCSNGHNRDYSSQDLGLDLYHTLAQGKPVSCSYTGIKTGFNGPPFVCDLSAVTTAQSR